MSAISGASTVNRTGFGSVRLREWTDCAESGPLPACKAASLFEYPVKNFGRFDDQSKLTCYAVALALRDARLAYDENTTTNTGILGTSPSGCLASNIAYFRDYVDCGRTLARGNLFLYTLPSSPVAEAAIHFGFTGPVLYVETTENRLIGIARVAARMIRDSQADRMVICEYTVDSASCLVLTDVKGDAELWSFDEFAGLLDRSSSATETITAMIQGQ